jgi:predicted membrane protein
MFNPVILVAIIIQIVVNRFSRKAAAIIGYFITTGILFWGISVYSVGNAITFFGITLSEPIFFIACLVWYAFDTRDLLAAIKGPAKINQPPVSQTYNGLTPPPLEGEQLTIPCRIVFHRDSNFIGAIAPQYVNLNGLMIGEVNNGKTLEFTTNKRTNSIVVTDRTGGASKPYPFTAVDGGLVEVHFSVGRFR